MSNTEDDTFARLVRPTYEDMHTIYRDWLRVQVSTKTSFDKWVEIAGRAGEFFKSHYWTIEEYKAERKARNEKDAY